MWFQRICEISVVLSFRTKAVVVPILKTGENPKLQTHLPDLYHGKNHAKNN
jgi:hypothetical protein